MCISSNINSKIGSLQLDVLVTIIHREVSVASDT
jgi:hypothetical protein